MPSKVNVIQKQSKHVLAVNDRKWFVTLDGS